jgi:hypothetical protein
MSDELIDGGHVVLKKFRSNKDGRAERGTGEDNAPFSALVRESTVFFRFTAPIEK